MDCSAFCTATSYRIKLLYEATRELFKSTLYRDVLHLSIPPHDGKDQGDVFFFSYGAIVCWGISQESVLHFIKEVKAFEDQPVEEIETDEFTYVYGKSASVIEDEITLPDRDVMTKLAISHGLAQSVKLGFFETAAQKTIDKTQYIPQNLAKYGKISLSRREIRRKMGELFVERNSINLHVNVLDSPELFWEFPELEPLYRMIANYLDIGKRCEVLNQRLDAIHDLFDMLGSELNHQHSSKLEWIIIYLIVIEVIVSLMRDVFRIL